INNYPLTNNPINLGLLNEIEGQLSTNIDKLTNDSLIINNLKAKLNITGGKLNITSVNANIYGGELSSTGYVNSGKDQNVAIKIDLKNAYLKNLTPQSGKIKITDGRLSFKADLTSHGNSVYTYINNLNECSLDASPAKANASGQINLPQYMMDISASVTIGDLPPIAVKLYGSINNPQHKLDIQALQTYLVKNVFNSVIKDLKSGEKK